MSQEWGLRQIKDEQIKIKVKFKSRANTVNDSRIAAYEKIAKDNAVDTGTLFSEEELAKHLKQLDAIIQTGNKKALKRKKQLLTAKTTMIGTIEKFDKQIEKLHQQRTDELAGLRVLEGKRMEALTKKMMVDQDKQRATIDQVNKLYTEVELLKVKFITDKEVKRLLALTENIRARIQTLENSHQKILEALKLNGIDTRVL